MDMRTLQYFLTVAEEGNITRSAELLYITQPTLSRQLMQLEKELGTKLFVRGRHSVSLTEEGQLFKLRAQELLALYDKAKQELVCGGEELAGEISIGCAVTRNMPYFVKILSAFQKEHPRVVYDVYTATADLVKDQMEKGLLDIGLVMNPGDLSKYECLQLPFREQRGIWVHKTHPLAGKKTVTPDDLIGQPLILSRRSEIKNELATWFGPRYDDLHIIAYYNLMDNVIDMALADMGVIVSIRIENMPDDLVFIPLSPAIQSTVMLAWKKHQTYSPLVSAFLRFAQDFVDRGN